MRQFLGILFACLSTAVFAAPEKLVLHAARATKPPVIDGDLNDDVWKNAEEITGFTQHDPNDGQPATQKTVIKVAYDDSAIYIAARLDDNKPVTTLLGRRDNGLESDWLRIYIDSRHDGLSGTEFWVNPSNVQLDGILYNDIYDDWSWDAVWLSAAKINVGQGWTAEVKIPLSQLRFAESEKQTWGVNFARRISSNNETDRLINTPKKETGFVSRFADLTGLDGIHPERALELMPYGVARSDLQNRIPAGDPYTRPHASKMEGGLDLKYGLSSNLTLTGTINPDFGQVEVDPAVVNLSSFETFFPEKRPFFTEGTNMFNYGDGPSNSRWNFNLFPPTYFYSRRIGRSPQGTSSLSADYLDAPGDTTILGAAKVTGKFGKGWSVGVLDALTNAEKANFMLNDLRASQTVEPMTNYFVGRMAKEYNDGNSRIGFLFENVKRRVPSELSFMRDTAYVAGVDGYKMFHKKDWLWEWSVSGTRVEGSPEAIDETQRSSAHYFNRPDADYLHYDPTRTSLDGWGMRTMLNKQTGYWRPNLQVSSFSPGFEVNDIGFMQRADIVATHAVINYVNEDVRKYVRQTNWWLGKYQNWNHGGDILANGLYGNWFVEAKNYMYAYGWAGHAWDVMDDRKTRGGPLAQRAGNRDLGVGVGTDSRKKVYTELEYGTFDAKDGAYSKSLRLYLNYRPSTNVRLNITPSFTRSHDATQYVNQVSNPTNASTFGTDYVFGNLEQRTFDMGARVEWTVSARLSLQMYMQPFVATGDYHDFQQLGQPRSGIYTPYAGSPDNPDFDFRSLRGSAVVRYEFRPGSAVYFVWNENRADSIAAGDFHLRNDISALRNAPSKDVFLIKVSYWLPM